MENKDNLLSLNLGTSNIRTNNLSLSYEPNEITNIQHQNERNIENHIKESKTDKTQNPINEIPRDIKIQI